MEHIVEEYFAENWDGLLKPMLEGRLGGLRGGQKQLSERKEITSLVRMYEDQTKKREVVKELAKKTPAEQSQAKAMMKKELEAELEKQRRLAKRMVGKSIKG
jgi:hypothetical protein